MLDLAEALPHVDLRVRDDVFYTCRALLVHRHDDLAIFDRAFDLFWSRGRNRTESGEQTSAGRTGPRARDDGSRLDGEGRRGFFGPAADTRDAEATGVGALRTWSDAVRLSTKDFAAFTAEEIAIAQSALGQLVWSPGTRRSRRWIAGAGPRLDMRRVMRRSLRTGGDVFSLPRRAPRRLDRPVVLLCDVSGSMERYSRMLLHFAHALGRRHRRFEAFLFSTGLTRITAELRAHKLDEAISAVARAVPDWSGGTRIGEAIRALRRPSTRRVLSGRPVILVVSDGWDRGDPIVLRDEMARLQRNCHRLIWLNPLIGTLDYAPLTRGLQAALPFVDDFLPARTLMNLADLAVQLNRIAPRGRRR
jgi:uncharacterized protein with von Willebrand factor type A (vWA) domain